MQYTALCESTLSRMGAFKKLGVSNVDATENEVMTRNCKVASSLGMDVTAFSRVWYPSN